MYKSLIAITSLALAPFAAAVGSARVVNKCNHQVTLWSVGGSLSPAYNLAANGGTYSEPFTYDPQSGGRALKITNAPTGLFTGAPETIFAYTLQTASNQIWYDLSDVFGDAFAGSKLIEKSSNGGCPVIEWDNGVPPAGSQVKVCEANSDVTLTLCA
ncbi:hypothetical protein BT63DRAFT_429941 [Microthyrium microscopicum]|uniref:Bys1 family protein n=1 Tax=Microthyrium microscopicum TaxID=703497 RepID=A0A6A6TWE7_9PEZI|nr:hypothetical protein BT63DRAFT_429941 [Microthyrium microscopicum]